MPNYLTMSPDLAFVKYEKAPGELYYPETVTIDSNNRIFVFSERGEFLTSFTPQVMKYPWISYTQELPVCD